MYDLNQYIVDATRTESRIDTVVVDPNFLAGVLQIFIASGNMLDQIKKHVFYGKLYNTDKLTQEFLNIVNSLDQLKPSIVGEMNEGPVAVDPRVFHALVGIATESSELMEALARGFSGERLDSVNLLEECFDVDWYQFILLDALGGDLEKMWKVGFDKLRHRYPDKFSSEDAINRDSELERKILEDGLKS